MSSGVEGVFLVAILCLVGSSHQLTVDQTLLKQNITAGQKTPVTIRVTNDGGSEATLDISLKGLRSAPLFWPKDSIWTAEDYDSYWSWWYASNESDKGVWAEDKEAWLPSGGQFHSFGFRESPGLFSARYFLPGGSADFVDHSKASPWDELAFAPALSWSEGGPFSKTGMKTLPFFPISDVSRFFGTFHGWNWVGGANWRWSDIWGWGWVGTARWFNPAYFSWGWFGMARWTPWYYEGGAISGHERWNPLHGHPGIQRSWGYVGIARWNPDWGWTGIARAEENRTIEDISRWNPGWGWVGIARGYNPYEYTGFGWVGNGRWSFDDYWGWGWVAKGRWVSPAYHGWGWFGIARWHPAAYGWGWTGIARWLDSYFGVLGHVGLGRWNNWMPIGIARWGWMSPGIQRWGWAPPGIQRWGWMSPGFQRWGWGSPGIQRIWMPVGIHRTWGWTSPGIQRSFWGSPGLQRWSDWGSPGIQRSWGDWGAPGIQRWMSGGIQRWMSPGIARSTEGGEDGMLLPPGFSRWMSGGIQRWGSPGIQRWNSPGIQRCISCGLFYQEEVAGRRLEAAPAPPATDGGSYSPADPTMEMSPTASTWKDVSWKIVPIGYFSYNNTFYPWGVYKSQDGVWHPWGFIRSRDGAIKPWGFEYQNLTTPTASNYGGARFWAVYEGHAEPIGFFKSSNWRPNFHDCAIGEFPASAHLSNFDLSLFETSAWRKSEVTPRDLGMKAGTTWESLVGAAKDHVLHKWNMVLLSSFDTTAINAATPDFYWKNITPPPARQLKAKQGGGGSRRLSYVDFPSSTLFRVSGDWNYTEAKANEYLIRSVKVDDDNKILAVTLDTSSASLFGELNATAGSALFSEMVNMGFFTTSPANTQESTAAAFSPVFTDLDLWMISRNRDVINTELFNADISMLYSLGLFHLSDTTGTVPWLPMPLPLFLTADDFAKLSNAHAAIEADIQESLDLNNVTNATQTARRALQAKEEHTTSADKADLPGGKGGKSGRELTGTPPSGSITALGLPPRILVVYHNATAAEAGRRRLSGLTDIDDKLGDAIKEHRKMNRSHVDILELYVDPSSPANITEFQRHVDDICSDETVAACEEDQVVKATGTVPNDPSFGNQWGMMSIGAPDAWSVTTGSSAKLPNGPVVAVLDTGVDYTHNDLKDNLWVNQAELNGQAGVDDDGNGYIDDIYGYDFRNQDGDPMDDAGHGTHVAGVIAAKGNNGAEVSGVAWNAQIMALKFLAADGSGLMSDAIEALEYAVDHGAHVTSNSWGGVRFSAALYNAIVANMKANQLFICAAGNEGYDNDAMPDFPATFGIPNMVTVTAHDEEGHIPYWASYGNETIHLAAPGANIVSTVPTSLFNESLYTANGTSMAVPHVTGAVALMLAVNPDLTWAQQKDVLLQSGTPLSENDTFLTVTEKRLNVSKALQMTAGLTSAVSYPATATVAAGATVDVTVEVDAVTAGQYGATLDIQSGGSGVTSSLRLLALGGSSLSPALPPSLSVGKSAVHVPSPAVEVPIANSGPGVLAVQVQDVTGDHANDFEVLPPRGMIVTVSPNQESHLLKVRCIPSKSGTRTATLHLATNEGSPTGREVATSKTLTLTCEGASFGVSPASIRERIPSNTANTYKVKISNEDTVKGLMYSAQLGMDTQIPTAPDYVMTTGDFFWFENKTAENKLTFESGERETEVALPFPVPYFGGIYSTMKVSLDGSILLGYDGVINGYASSELSTADGVYVEVDEHDVTVHWSGFKYAGAGTINFQVVLEESGPIHFLYENVHGITHADAFNPQSDKHIKVGLKSATTHKAVSATSAYPTTGTAIHYMPISAHHWMTMAGTPHGIIPPKGQTELRINVAHFLKETDGLQVCYTDPDACDLSRTLWSGGQGVLYLKTNDTFMRLPLEFSPLMETEGAEITTGGVDLTTVEGENPLLQFDRYSEKELLVSGDFPVFTVKKAASCARKCLEETSCKSFDYEELAASCKMSRSTKDDDPTKFVTPTGRWVDHYEVKAAAARRL
ncbi:unnamed protein product [Vitrella brassicaformis CCMP3155]|uniref:subtilisin n=2 Tax=Vitrella brassicaformis TaxID=1169539 RepID=A0A0G4ED81_VITBC|nr:unnamed protein product [Vitrella brassicaformis CCMP3155]|eukprot:CEL93642.1 unnamed protein product [Vitrella brassicaformis CCMP3155]